LAIHIETGVEIDARRVVENAIHIALIRANVRHIAIGNLTHAVNPSCSVETRPERLLDILHRVDPQSIDW
jgi:hypothetical protein